MCRPLAMCGGQRTDLRNKFSPCCFTWVTGDQNQVARLRGKHFHQPDLEFLILRHPAPCVPGYRLHYHTQFGFACLNVCDCACLCGVSECVYICCGDQRKLAGVFLALPPPYLWIQGLPSGPGASLVV